MCERYVEVMAGDPCCELGEIACDGGVREERLRFSKAEGEREARCSRWVILGLLRGRVLSSVKVFRKAIPSVSRTDSEKGA